MTSEKSQYYIEPLDPKKHNRKSFDCGEKRLNEYLQRYARQNQDNNTAVTYVLTKEDGSEGNKKEILGYYTLSSSAVSFERIPERDRGGLPKSVPMILLGRFAVDKSMQGQGLGKHLLIDALKTSLKVSDSIGAYGIHLDAINDEARQFYEHFGFESLENVKYDLFMSIDKVKASVRT